MTAADPEATGATPAPFGEILDDVAAELGPLRVERIVLRARLRATEARLAAAEARARELRAALDAAAGAG